MNIYYAVYANDVEIPLLVTRRYKDTCKFTDSLINTGSGCSVIETSSNGIRCVLEVKAHF